MIKTMQWLTVILTVLVLCTRSILASNTAEKTYAVDEARGRLMKDILNNYHPSARPGRDRETDLVFVNLELQHYDFRETDGSFHFVGVLHARWWDPKLVWNPHNYGNMSHIIMSQKYVWVPDLEFWCSLPDKVDKFIRMYRKGFVTVKNNGVVFWSDTIEVNIFCDTYMKNWPHYKHECYMYLGSWTFYSYEVDIRHLEPNNSMTISQMDAQNMKYKITKFNASRNASEHPFVYLNYDITFERKSSFAIVFRVPAMCIILFTLISLRMEPLRTEKLWLNGLSFVLISWHLIYFARSIGHLTRETPYIVIFFSTSLVMVTFSQLLAVFSLFATRSRFKGYLPCIIERFCNSTWTLRLVPIEVKRDQLEDLNGQFEEVKLDDTSYLIGRNLLSNDWLRFAKILNCLAFLAYAMIFLILTSVCFV